MINAVSVTGKTCDLRQQCEICLVWYGRKIQLSGKGKGHFASEKLFRKTRTCGSRKCASAMGIRTKRQQRAQKDEASREVGRAFDAFMLPGIRL